MPVLPAGCLCSLQAHSTSWESVKLLPQKCSRSALAVADAAQARRLCLHRGVGKWQHSKRWWVGVCVCVFVVIWLSAGHEPLKSYFSWLKFGVSYLL